jgi:hypothetical protein
MLLSFVDETSDSKYPEYFGLCVATINSALYRGVKSAFQQILIDNGWNPEIEFKGSYLFSASKGPRDITVEKRVAIASSILNLTASEKNARMKFYYLKTKATDHKTTYLKFLPLLLKEALPTACKKSGKDLFALHCDQRHDIDEKTIREAVLKKVCDKGYTLYEDVVLVKSCFHTVGILYADIVGYLLGRIDAISMDSDLFDGISEEDFDSSGQLRKLKSSKELVNKVKTIKRYVGKLKKK